MRELSRKAAILHTSKECFFAFLRGTSVVEEMFMLGACCLKLFQVWFTLFHMVVDKRGTVPILPQLNVSLVAACMAPVRRSANWRFPVPRLIVLDGVALRLHCSAGQILCRILPCAFLGVVIFTLPELEGTCILRKKLGYFSVLLNSVIPYTTLTYLTGRETSR